MPYFVQFVSEEVARRDLPRLRAMVAMAALAVAALPYTSGSVHQLDAGIVLHGGETPRREPGRGPGPSAAPPRR